MGNGLGLKPRLRWPVRAKDRGPPKQISRAEETLATESNNGGLGTLDGRERSSRRLARTVVAEVVCYDVLLQGRENVRCLKTV